MCEETSVNVWLYGYEYMRSQGVGEENKKDSCYTLFDIN